MEECGYFYATTDSGEIRLLGKIDEKIVEKVKEIEDSTDEKEEEK